MPSGSLTQRNKPPSGFVHETPGGISRSSARSMMSRLLRYNAVMRGKWL